MAIVEVSVIPIGTDSPSISSYVAKCQDIVERQKKVDYQLTPMGTVLEGNLSDCLELVKELHEVPFAAGAERVATQVKIDDRRDKKASMQQKLSSVKEKLK